MRRLVEPGVPVVLAGSGIARPVWRAASLATVTAGTWTAPSESASLTASSPGAARGGGRACCPPQRYRALLGAATTPARPDGGRAPPAAQPGDACVPPCAGPDALVSARGLASLLLPSPVRLVRLAGAVTLQVLRRTACTPRGCLHNSSQGYPFNRSRSVVDTTEPAGRARIQHLSRRLWRQGTDLRSSG